ncbi:MAG TPA: hypothetical protein VMU33_10735 [Burkholderiaceae bacterium]|nr:hypothetical protein [Burkholderiaceae bacterium]
MLSFPRHSMPGTWDGVKEGLRRADVRIVVEVAIQDGTDIAYEVGPHVGRELVTPAQLADVTLPDSAAVLMRADGDKARANCEDYFGKFLVALEHATGNVHLFVEMRDDDFARDRSCEEFDVLAFDGALSVDEMAAYVGMRMLGRHGPGSTHLLRALVNEFAGFDARLAERLIAFSDAEILGLPGSLTTVLEEDPLRWRTESWTEGTHATLYGSTVRHPLHEWHLALHAGIQQTDALKAAKRRYWRACVRALTPWLEERRTRVLRILKKPIDEVLAANGGRFARELANGKTIEVDRDEFDYNNVVGLVYYHGLRVPEDSASQRAVGVCRIAKIVRDELAHLRAPKLQDILALITTMDALLA